MCLVIGQEPPSLAVAQAGHNYTCLSLVYPNNATCGAMIQRISVNYTDEISGEVTTWNRSHNKLCFNTTSCGTWTVDTITGPVSTVKNCTNVKPLTTNATDNITSGGQIPSPSLKLQLALLAACVSAVYFLLL